MDQKSFKEPVEIIKISLKDILGKEKGLQLEKSIRHYYREKNIKNVDNRTDFYSVRRTEEGLVHPAFVTLFPISFKSRKKTNYSKNFAVLRFYEKNKDDNEEYFDRAKYHVARMKTLKSLGKYYPPFLIYESNISNGFIIFQKFFFYPICKFNTSDSIMELFNLMYYSSVKELFLDYNQNHFLWDSKRKSLLYTDADYIEDYPFEKAVIENFNQATIYLTLDNTKFFSNAIKSFKKSHKKLSAVFYKIIIDLIKEKLDNLQSRPKTQVIENRIKSYKIILIENS
ncbi:MAG: hypothetical protein HeimC3_19880 [Candidatus Heimdallarchaeota archaeon LC_3]|nr:MAG: hypothetical protein HeimC3_19880 [Candidatus Heimdallarchaeota archaeon LC_3]